MTQEPQEPQDGHDGPYPTPITTSSRIVPPEWIDYNGHMNVAFYTMALDRCLDEVFDGHIGMGEGAARRLRMGPYALQSHMHYLDELLEGEAFHGRVILLDHDHKRVHLAVEIIRERDGAVAAVAEQLAMNVDLVARRSTDYPAWTQARLAQMKADHADVARPARIGAGIGIRRRP